MAGESQDLRLRRRERGALGSALGSVIGRRFLALFATCAIVPLGTISIVAVLHVRSTILDEAHKRLASSAKIAGTSITERLLFLETDLTSLAASIGGSSGSGPPRLTEHLRQRVSERFDGLALLAPDGGQLAVGLDRIGELPAMGQVDRERLALGRTVLLVQPEPDGVALFMARQVEIDEGACLLAGRIRSGYLWGGAIHAPLGTELLVLDRRYRVLHATTQHRLPIAQRRELLVGDPDGRFFWNKAEREYVGAHSALPLGYRFNSRWIVAHSQPLDRALGSFYEFRGFFIVVTVLSLALILLLSMVRIRQTLRPVAMLRAATRRVADGDFGVALEIDSGDEFEDVGEAFNEMVKSLEDNVRERNRNELELIQAWRESDDAKRTENEFIQNVSHELRTPITSVLSAAEILRDYGADDAESRREFMSIIISEAQRLTELIDNVLDLSEMRSDKAWTFEDVDVEQVLREVVETHRGAASARGIRIDLSLPGEGLPTVAHRQRLSKVASYLVSNAIKFSHDGGDVHVRGRTAGRFIVVEVEDHGCGIDAKDHELVFEQFRQLSHDPLTDKPKGTGLGLAMAKGMIERHGGSIELESEAGKGALFRFTLPVRQAVDTERAAWMPAAAH